MNGYETSRHLDNQAFSFESGHIWPV